MSRLKHVLLALTLALGLYGPAGAATISFFGNADYVDMTREGPNMVGTLTGLGHSVNTFTGITAADFATATTGVGILVFPEMENRELNADLDAAARAALLAFVTGGGHIIQANYFSGNSSLPNALFGFALAESGTGETLLDAIAAVGTGFAGGPAVATDNSAVQGVLSSSLPLGALNIYHDDDESAVFRVGVGAGLYTYLGFDWFEDNPIPAAWEEITCRAIDGACGGAAVPEPGVPLLVALGVLGLWLTRKRQSAQ